MRHAFFEFFFLSLLATYVPVFTLHFFRYPAVPRHVVFSPRLPTSSAVYKVYGVKDDIDTNVKLQPGDLTPSRLRTFFEFKSTSTWKRTKMCCHIFGRDTQHSTHDIVRLLSLGPNHWSKLEKRVSTCWKHTKVLMSVLLSILVRESKEYLLQEVLLRRLICLDKKRYGMCSVCCCCHDIQYMFQVLMLLLQRTPFLQCFDLTAD